MNASTLPNRLWPFALHFFRQFIWGCVGLLVFSILGRAVFASIAYATKRLTDTVLAMHNPAAEASKLVKPFTLFVVLVVARFVMDAAMGFSSYHTRSPMLVRIKEEVFAYAQRLSSAYFENTLSGKIAHRTVLLPDQVLALFDMTVFDFIPGACFFVFVAAYFYIASPLFSAAAFAAVAAYFTVSLFVGRECTRRASYRAVVRLRSVQYVMDIAMWIVFVGGALYAWVHRLIGAGDFVMITALTSSLLQTAYNIGQRIPEFYDQLGSAR